MSRSHVTDDRVVIEQASYYDAMEARCRRSHELDRAVEKEHHHNAAAEGSWARNTVSTRQRAVIPSIVRGDITAWLPGLSVDEIMRLASAPAFSVKHHLSGDETHSRSPKGAAAAGVRVDMAEAKDVRGFRRREGRGRRAAVEGEEAWLMPSYFARTPRRRRGAVRWKATTPKLARLLGIPAKTRKKPKTEEHDAQVALFNDHIVPRLVSGAVAFAIPNGGHRAKREAIKIKEEGGAAGVPDIFALHRRQVYFLEMKKARGGRVSKEQNDMMARLVGAGAICAVAKGLAEAIQQLEGWGLLRVAVADTDEMAA